MSEGATGWDLPAFEEDLVSLGIQDAFVVSRGVEDE